MTSTGPATGTPAEAVKVRQLVDGSAQHGTSATISYDAWITGPPDGVTDEIEQIAREHGFLGPCNPRCELDNEIHPLLARKKWVGGITAMDWRKFRPALQLLSLWLADDRVLDFYYHLVAGENAREGEPLISWRLAHARNSGFFGCTYVSKAHAGVYCYALMENPDLASDNHEKLENFILAWNKYVHDHPKLSPEHYEYAPTILIPVGSFDYLNSVSLKEDGEPKTADVLKWYNHQFAFTMLLGHELAHVFTEHLRRLDRQIVGDPRPAFDHEPFCSVEELCCPPVVLFGASPAPEAGHSWERFMFGQPVNLMNLSTVIGDGKFHWGKMTRPDYIRFLCPRIYATREVEYAGTESTVSSYFIDSGEQVPRASWVVPKEPLGSRPHRIRHSRPSCRCPSDDVFHSEGVHR